MPKRTSKKPPTDINLLAVSVVQAATEQKATPETAVHEAAVALGRLGGLKGGKARAEKLPPARRKAIAKKAAAARWSKRQAAAPTSSSKISRVKSKTISI